MAVGTLIDANVILDILTSDPTWAAWSEAALASAAEAGPLFINPVIYAEVSVRFSHIEDLEEALPPNDFQRAQLPWEAAFLAAKAFVSYRGRGGMKLSPLPDFFIGAHAAVSNYRLLTRDASRYQTYFPSLDLIRPST